MKKLLLLLLLAPHLVSAQWFYDYPFYQFHNFEDTTFSAQIYSDTLSNPNSLWQVGEPSKTVFSSAYSANKAILTDTVNAYPINDTSSFIIWHEAQSGFSEGYTDAHLNGYYWVNSDSLNDFGKIEFSYDHGASWILISDDTTAYLGWGGTVQYWPQVWNTSFTGNSNGWQEFHINMSENVLDSLPINSGDTVMFKFSFISDGTFDGLDGLMFDNIEVIDWFAFGIDELGTKDLVLYPNPTNDVIYLENNVVNYTTGTVTIINELGQVVLTKLYSDEALIQVDCSKLSKGTYTLMVSGEHQEIVGSGRFVVD